MRIIGVRIYQLYAPLFFTLICQEGIKGKMKFDKEYATSFVDEYKYLKEYGIRYEFIKVDDTGKTVWKYKKTPELFEALKNFYINNEYYD